MKKVGILVGREKTFPDALINNINERSKGEVTAEFLKLGGIRHDAPPRYDLVIDRISHEVPFYRATLKRMALEGTIIVNNPFWWSADDKFFNFSLAPKLGVAVPRTVLLPQKDYIPGIVSESLRNLEFPLDWQAIVDYVGLPAILKPFDGGGWKNVSRVNTLDELWYEYDQTGTLCMTLQEFIDFDQFVRCYCVGQEDVMIMAYDPRKPYLSGEQYIHNPNYLAPELAQRVTKDVRTLCTGLGYDLNTVEFAIKDDVPYAIDFMNPAPDAELASVGEFYHNWITNAVTNLIFKRLAEGRERPRYRWDALLNPEPVRTFAVASPVDQQSRTVVPTPTDRANTNASDVRAAASAEAPSPLPSGKNLKSEIRSGTARVKSDKSAKPRSNKDRKSSSARAKTN
ncbi:MAG: RimK family alpha-L-glutamate ligase [Pyrinomonadaceae bacterium]